VALGAEKLLLLTDVDGLYRDWPTSTEVISELDAVELRELLPGLRSGMIPKMEACLRAVEGGVPRAHVLDGRVTHALLVEVFTDEGIGTMVYSPRPTSLRSRGRRAPSRTARND
jgi:acetylglutamate kinase